MEEMIEARFTPAHANALKALLNQPFTSAFDHATAEGQPELFEAFIIDVVLMLGEIIMDLGNRFAGTFR